MIVRKFWLPSLSAAEAQLPTEYVVDTGAEVLEPVGDVYVEGGDEEKRDMLDLETHARAKEFVLCASLCNVAT